MEGIKSLAAVLHGKENMKLEYVTIQEPEDNEVQVLMGSVGICGSDLKYWMYGQCGRFKLDDNPMIIGHEGSGTITKVGKCVKHLKKGDRVAIEPTIPCRCCSLCKSGRYNLCPDVTCCATPPVDGNISQYYNHSADFCYRLPDHVSLDEGAMLEPLAVAVYGCQRGNVGIGSSVLICGAGPVGCLTLLVARSLGAHNICITDIDEHRLAVAKGLGADKVVKVTTQDNKVLAEEIEITMGCKPDITLECSGSDASLITGLYCTRSGGCVVLIGRGSLEPTIPIMEAAVREVDIKGVFRYANCYPKALAMVSSGSIDVKPLISHHFTLKETLEAFKTAISKDAKAIKVMIHCDQ